MLPVQASSLNPQHDQFKVSDACGSRPSENSKILIPKPIVPPTNSQVSEKLSNVSFIQNSYPLQPDIQQKVAEMLQNQSLLVPLLFSSTHFTNFVFNPNSVTTMNKDQFKLSLNPNFYPEAMKISFQNTGIRSTTTTESSVAEKGEKSESEPCSSGLNVGHTKKISKSKPNISCGHPDKEHYAKGLCKSCYHKIGRNKKPWNCSHERLYAKGLCQKCYVSKYRAHHKKLAQDDQDNENICSEDLEN